MDKLRFKLYHKITKKRIFSIQLFQIFPQLNQDPFLIYTVSRVSLVILRETWANKMYVT
jgi:hypothetical protein